VRGCTGKTTGKPAAYGDSDAIRAKSPDVHVETSGDSVPARRGPANGSGASLCTAETAQQRIDLTLPTSRIFSGRPFDSSRLAPSFSDGVNQGSSI